MPQDSAHELARARLARAVEDVARPVDLGHTALGHEGDPGTRARARAPPRGSRPASTRYGASRRASSSPAPRSASRSSPRPRRCAGPSRPSSASAS